MNSKSCSSVFMLGLMAVLALMSMRPASGHPFGNESITRFSVLYLYPDRLEIRLLLDFAEISSARLLQADIEACRSDEELDALLEERARELTTFLKVRLDGEPVSLLPEDENGAVRNTRMLVTVPGIGGMPTYRLLLTYTGAYPHSLSSGIHSLAYENATFRDYVGMKRILLYRTDEVHVFPPCPAYYGDGPDPFLYEQYDPLSLPQEESAQLRFSLAADHREVTASEPERAGDHSADFAGFLDPRKNSAVTDYYSNQAQRIFSLMKGERSLWVLLSVTLLALIWGAAHALMPGHAKTLVGAYLISRQGTYWQAAFLAIMVTMTHTALVMTSGIVIWAFQESDPLLGARLHIILGMLAGLLTLIMGVALFWRGATGQPAHSHRDPANHGHSQESRWFRRVLTHSHPHPHPHPHPHVHRQEAAEPPSGADSSRPVTPATLAALAVSGGAVPCPTAVIILLLGIAGNMVSTALYVVFVFSVGLALTLMGVAFAALGSRKLAKRFLLKHGPSESALGRTLLLRIVPVGSGATVACLGAAITLHYFHLFFFRVGLFAWLG
jgi:nickel/cobalt transporter (NicO) family protein